MTEKNTYNCLFYNWERKIERKPTWDLEVKTKMFISIIFFYTYTCLFSYYKINDFDFNLYKKIPIYFSFIEK